MMMKFCRGILRDFLGAPYNSQPIQSNKNPQPKSNLAPKWKIAPTISLGLHYHIFYLCVLNLKLSVVLFFGRHLIHNIVDTYVNSHVSQQSDSTERENTAELIHFLT